MAQPRFSTMKDSQYLTSQWRPTPTQIANWFSQPSPLFTASLAASNRRTAKTANNSSGQRTNSWRPTASPVPRSQYTVKNIQSCRCATSGSPLSGSAIGGKSSLSNSKNTPVPTMPSSICSVSLSQVSTAAPHIPRSNSTESTQSSVYSLYLAPIKEEANRPRQAIAERQTQSHKHYHGAPSKGLQGGDQPEPPQLLHDSKATSSKSIPPKHFTHPPVVSYSIADHGQDIPWCTSESHSYLDTTMFNDGESHREFVSTPSFRLPPVICRDGQSGSDTYCPVGARVEYYAEPDKQQPPVKLATKYYVLPEIQRDPLTGRLTELRAGYWTETPPSMIPDAPALFHPPEVVKPTRRKRVMYYRHRGVCEKLGGCCGWGVDNLAKCAFNLALRGVTNDGSKKQGRG